MIEHSAGTSSDSKNHCTSFGDIYTVFTCICNIINCFIGFCLHMYHLICLLFLVRRFFFVGLLKEHRSNYIYIYISMFFFFSERKKPKFNTRVKKLFRTHVENTVSRYLGLTPGSLTVRP